MNRNLLDTIRKLLCLAALALCFGWFRASAARAQLGPPDVTAMQSLRDNFGWGAAFGWNNAADNPCSSLGENWNGVTCQLGRVTKLDLTCGAVKLNLPFPNKILYMDGLKELTLRSCFTGGIQATEFSSDEGGKACSGFCSPMTMAPRATKLRFDTGNNYRHD